MDTLDLSLFQCKNHIKGTQRRREYVHTTTALLQIPSAQRIRRRPARALRKLQTA